MHEFRIVAVANGLTKLLRRKYTTKREADLALIKLAKATPGIKFSVRVKQ